MADPATPDKPPFDYIVRGLRHELVQPLHSLGLLIDLAPAAVRDEANAPWLGKLKRSVDGLSRMVAGLADISRLDLQPLPVDPASTDIAKLLRDVADRADAVRRPDTIVSIASTRVVTAVDQRLLRLGLACLVDNALRHGQARRVLLGVRRRGRGWLVAVWDNGAGIPEAEQDFCLSPLGTGSAARMSGTAGIGLGLTIAQRAASSGGMGFHFKSVAGRGTAAGFSLA
jgi:signal transduction histidine kinase